MAAAKEAAVPARAVATVATVARAGRTAAEAVESIPPSGRGAVATGCPEAERAGAGASILPLVRAGSAAEVRRVGRAAYLGFA